MSKAAEISGCEVCGNPTLESVLDLGSHPLCDDLVPIDSLRTCNQYPIEILLCRRCLTGHQRFQVAKEELFPRTYHYRSRFTADVLNGMDDLVASCERRLGGLRGKTVLDIGCNDGSLLDRFAARGAITVGIEPTDACGDAAGRGHALYQRYFDVVSADQILAENGTPDIVTFTNVFAHIEHLDELLAALGRLTSTRTTLVIENHYLGAVLAHRQFDTFYHEHPRTYSLSSFLAIARSLRSRVAAVEFPSRYGGNIRVFIGGLDNDASDAELIERTEVRERPIPGQFSELRKYVDHWRITTAGRLRQLASVHGPLSAKAFPGRAAILLRLLDIDVETIGEVFEKPGSMKIGHYVPGTRIPIRSDDELFARDVQPPVLINLAWHIRSEIERYLRERGYQGDILSVVEPETGR